MTFEIDDTNFTHPPQKTLKIFMKNIFHFQSFTKRDCFSKTFHFFVLSFFLLTNFNFSKTNSSVVDSTEYFEFHNNYWINLHHFLYQKATGSQLKNLAEDGMSFIDIGENSVFTSLTNNQIAILDKAVKYYSDNFAGKSLIRDLGNLRVWLQERDLETTIIDTSFTKAYTDILNEVSPVYKENFWRIHSEHNKLILNEHLDMIKKLEPVVMPRMEELSGDKMPDEKLRFDLTAYANYAGAYTPVRPKPNVLISSLDPYNFSSAFIETVFHEASHLLYTRESLFRAKIFFTSKDLGIEFDGGLWHASLFYLAGILVKDLLKEEGIDHKLVMDERNIYSSYNTPMFREIHIDYYNGKVDMDTTIKKLVKERDSNK